MVYLHCAGTPQIYNCDRGHHQNGQIKCTNTFYRQIESSAVGHWISLRIIGACHPLAPWISPHYQSMLSTTRVFRRALLAWHFFLNRSIFAIKIQRHFICTLNLHNTISLWTNVNWATTIYFRLPCCLLLIWLKTGWVRCCSSIEFWLPPAIEVLYNTRHAAVLDRILKLSQSFAVWLW